MPKTFGCPNCLSENVQVQWEVTGSVYYVKDRLISTELNLEKAIAVECLKCGKSEDNEDIVYDFWMKA